MMAILSVVLVGTAVALMLIFAGRLPNAARVPVIATLMVGMAGWLIAGSPGVAGAPVIQPENEGFGERIDDPRQGLAGRFGPASQWLGLSDGLMRRGRTEMAARTLAEGLKRHPRNIDLWVGYGNAMVAHSGGIMTPAAAMAFDRAAAIEPAHPAPPFFAGLALAQSGDVVGARAVWRELLARAPADAPWRADLEARLSRLPPRPEASAQPLPAPR